MRVAWKSGYKSKNSCCSQRSCPGARHWRVPHRLGGVSRQWRYLALHAGLQIHGRMEAICVV